MSGRGRPFEPGNTFGKGRPPGSRNKKTLLLQQIMLDGGSDFVSSTIDRAVAGDSTALELCVGSCVPRLRPVSELPVEQSTEDPAGLRVFIENPDGTVRELDPPAPMDDLPAEESDPTVRTAEFIERESPAPFRVNGGGKPFEPGNTFGQGRPKGSKNKISWELQQQLLDRGEELIFALMKHGKEGHRKARKLVWDRLIPRLKPVDELPVEAPAKSTKRMLIKFVPGLSQDQIDALLGDKKTSCIMSESIDEQNGESDETMYPQPTDPTPTDIDSVRKILARCSEIKPVNYVDALSEAKSREGSPERSYRPGAKPYAPRAEKPPSWVLTPCWWLYRSDGETRVTRKRKMGDSQRGRNPLSSPLCATKQSI